MLKSCAHACFNKKCMHNNLFTQQNVVTQVEVQYNKKVVQMTRTGKMISERTICRIKKSQSYIENH